ncbi:hypothetical protein HYQ46_003292 [Verticillium longisporum]|nr:hypothetical protein HYQ46_003292 [Verticillium longisporum]
MTMSEWRDCGMGCNSVPLLGLCRGGLALEGPKRTPIWSSPDPGPLPTGALPHRKRRLFEVSLSSCFWKNAGHG